MNVERHRRAADWLYHGFSFDFSVACVMSRLGRPDHPGKHNNSDVRFLHHHLKGKNLPSRAAIPATMRLAWQLAFGTRLTEGSPHFSMCSFVPNGVTLKLAVTIISPGKLGFSNLSE